MNPPGLDFFKRELSSLGTGRSSSSLGTVVQYFKVHTLTSRVVMTETL